MKNFLGVAFMGALLCAVAVAQSSIPSPAEPGAAQPPAAQPVPQTSQAPTPAPTQAPQTSQPATSPQPGGTQTQPAGAKKIAPGSVIPVQLTKTIDAKKAKTGDEVVAKVTQDMKTSTGELLVPKDTKVFGKVTEAQPRSKDQKESQLAIAFDHAVTKDGTNLQLPMSIQAIVGPQNNQAPEGGGEQGAAPSGGAPSAGGGGRSPMAGGSTPPPSASPSAVAGAPPSDNPPAANGGRPPINAQTTGVIGLSNINLSPNSNATQGSVVTSEKNNVKLESGTVLLLRVNQ
ncbi:MAG TPA: hypothetical protein VFO46_08295 [Candidatus Sulfotelmatobacter sp.]|nr:hypothetical protein [Candidatus Sulfotelmatobacter sp.]